MASFPTDPAVHSGGKPDAAAASYGPETGNGWTASSESVSEFYAANGYYILPDALAPGRSGRTAGGDDGYL